MEFQTFHRYNRLAKRGMVKPLSCPDCDNPYTLRTTEDAEPLLQCFYCDTLVQPGLRLYNDIRAVVTEFYA